MHPILDRINRATLDTAARYYQDIGLQVVPLHNGNPCSCGRDCGSEGKHPRFGGWQHAEYSADWWVKWPSANIGLVLVRHVVVDIDVATAAEGLDLPRTLTASTGRGLHLYYRGTRGNGLVRPGVDIKGQGGLVVAPPSVHRSGRRYQWLGGRAAELPSWLTAAPERQAKLDNVVQMDRYRASALESELDRLRGAPAGMRHRALATAAYRMGRLGLDAHGVLANAGQCLGLPRGEVDRTVRDGLAAGARAR